jgi:hypothetical protein
MGYFILITKYQPSSSVAQEYPWAASSDCRKYLVE